MRKQVRPVVKRNHLKRLLREIYRQNKDRIVEGFAIVVVIGGKAEGLSFREIEKSFLQLLEKAGILNDSR